MRLERSSQVFARTPDSVPGGAPSSDPRTPDNLLRQQLDQLLVGLAERARPVPSLVPADAAEERALRIAQLTRGETPKPLRAQTTRPLDAGLFRLVDEARRLSAACPFGQLYRDRLDELELDFAILAAWGDSRRVRPLCARRYGRGDESVLHDGVEVSLYELARDILRALPPPPARSRTLPASDARGGPSVESWIREAALGIGLDVDVRVEARLASLAATGERTVFVSDRLFSLQEARRLAAHEVFGHLVVAANARAQPLRLLKVGLAGSFADQEGLALYLEEALGLMCEERLRTLAARVLATRFLHDGAAFGEAARALHVDHGFAPEAAVLLAERAYRGGGVARDAGYLLGYVRVRNAVRDGDATLDELRYGRVSLGSLPSLRELLAQGIVRPPCFAPSLERMRALVKHEGSGYGDVQRVLRGGGPEPRPAPTREADVSPCAAFASAAR